MLEITTKPISSLLMKMAYNTKIKSEIHVIGPERQYLHEIRGPMFIMLEISSKSISPLFMKGVGEFSTHNTGCFKMNRKNPQGE